MCEEVNLGVILEAHCSNSHGGESMNGDSCTSVNGIMDRERFRLDRNKERQRHDLMTKLGTWRIP